MVGCASATESAVEVTVPAVAGDAERGKTLYNFPVLGESAPGCITCHSLVPDFVLVGPSMAGIAQRAGTTEPNTSAELYLARAILAPDSHIVDGFTPGYMFTEYGDQLTEQEIADLIAYLMTLE